jgi:hypothetical protein
MIGVAMDEKLIVAASSPLLLATNLATRTILDRIYSFISR